jgi:RNA polymerase sigma factor (sigma-70 family)
VTSPPPTDAELVERCRAGDAAAWNLLVERFSRYVYAICTRGFGLEQHDAEDAFQEVFTRVYTRLDTLRDVSALRAWIAQLTRRVCLDQLERRSREEPSDELIMDDQSESVQVDLDAAFALREALAGLGEPCHEMLDRFFARDESYRTIGQELDLPAGTIASRISRCLKKLRQELEGRNSAVSGSNRQR